MAQPSKAEQKLISFSKKTFGEHLSELLLCGFGEERPLSSRDFMVELAGVNNSEKHLRLMFVAEGPVDTQFSLPRGKEPLVLVALLQLLISKGGEATYRLVYTCNDLLKQLGWESTIQSRARVEGSVMKYFHTFYQLSADSSGDAIDSRSERIRKVRAMVGQDFAGGEDAGLDNSMTNAVTFNIDFVEPLKQKKLFGIDWSRVERLTTFPIEFFNL